MIRRSPGARPPVQNGRGPGQRGPGGSFRRSSEPAPTPPRARR